MYTPEIQVVQDSLEREAVALIGKNYPIREMTLPELRTLVAYAYWKDGMDWDYVIDQTQRNSQWRDEAWIITTLQNTYGYK